MNGTEHGARDVADSYNHDQTARQNEVRTQY